MSYYREQLEAWLSDMEVKGGIVLDFGGAAKTLHGRVKTFLPDKYIVVDNHLEQPQHAADIFMDLNLPAQSQVIKWNEKTGVLLNQLADTAFCLEVAEYWWNPLQALVNIHSWLKSGGDLIISFPFVYPMHQPAAADYMRYTGNGVAKLLTVCGFKVIEMQARYHKSPAALRAAWAADGMHPLKNETQDHTGYLVLAKKL